MSYSGFPIADSPSKQQENTSLIRSPSLTSTQSSCSNHIKPWRDSLSSFASENSLSKASTANTSLENNQPDNIEDVFMCNNSPLSISRKGKEKEEGYSEELDLDDPLDNLLNVTRTLLTTSRSILASTSSTREHFHRFYALEDSLSYSMRDSEMRCRSALELGEEKLEELERVNENVEKLFLGTTSRTGPSPKSTPKVDVEVVTQDLLVTEVERPNTPITAQDEKPVQSTPHRRTQSSSQQALENLLHRKSVPSPKPTNSGFLSSIVSYTPFSTPPPKDTSPALTPQASKLRPPNHGLSQSLPTVSLGGSNRSSAISPNFATIFEGPDRDGQDPHSTGSEDTPWLPSLPTLSTDLTRNEADDLASALRDSAMLIKFKDSRAPRIRSRSSRSTSSLSIIQVGFTEKSKPAADLSIKTHFSTVDAFSNSKSVKKRESTHSIVSGKSAAAEVSVDESSIELLYPDVQVSPGGSMSVKTKPKDFGAPDIDASDELRKSIGHQSDKTSGWWTGWI